MKYNERFAAIDTTGGKYSTHKIPQWRMGIAEIQDYIDSVALDGDEWRVLQTA